MEHFQIDPVVIVAYPEQVLIIGIGIQIAAGIYHFLFRHRFLAVRLKIIPEYTPAQPHIEQVKPDKDLLQRFLQQLLVNLLPQSDTETKYVAQILSGYHRKDIGRIIQFMPS